MKLIQGLIVHDTPDGTVAVATGEAAKRLNGMLRLSETAAFIVRQMERDTTEEKIVDALTAAYSVEREIAARDVRALVERLDGAGLSVW